MRVKFFQKTLKAVLQLRNTQNKRQSLFARFLETVIRERNHRSTLKLNNPRQKPKKFYDVKVEMKNYEFLTIQDKEAQVKLIERQTLQ